MKTSTESLNDGTHVPGKRSRSFAGAAGRSPKGISPQDQGDLHRFLMFAAGAAGIIYYHVFGAVGFIPTSVLLISTILLFRLERPAIFFGHKMVNTTSTTSMVRVAQAEKSAAENSLMTTKSPNPYEGCQR